MKVFSLLSLFILISNFSFADGLEERKRIAPYYKSSSEKVEGLDRGCSRFTFKINYYGGGQNFNYLLYSVYEEEYDMYIDSTRTFSVDVKEGDYAFMFYIDNHEEIKTDTLEIKKGFEDVYQLNFFFTPHMYEVDKPVIYLYPEEKKKVDVKLNVVGELSFTYPVYNEGWSVTADPSGNIQHKGNTYNYLFWEAKSAPHNLANEAEGFIISGEESSEFLQEKLEAIGFNSKERADFITYWGPRMSSNENVFIHFLFDDECNEYAELIIEPSPDNLNRVYIVWAPCDSKLQASEQELSKLNRDGFTVLEWGGQEVPQISLEAN